MKIALCLYKYFPFGGLQRDFLRIANVLIKRGHHVRVYTQSWQGTKVDNLELILVPTHAITNHGRNRQYYAWVQQHLSKNPVDRVVGFNKMPGLDIYYGADVCYAEKVENEKKGLLYRLSPRYKHYALFEKETVAFGLKTKLLIIDPKQKTEFQKHYQTEDSRFYLLPPGIAKDRKYTSIPFDARERVRKLLNLKPNEHLLLQIGSDFLRKGVDRSINALASLPLDVRANTKLCVIGQDHSEKFQALASKHGLKEQVLFFQGRNDVPDFIAAADLFLHPARSENTGTVILEALVGGLPEIVTETCGYSPYVLAADSGMIIPEPYEQVSFNTVLLTALTEKGLIEKWQDNAKHFADTEDLYSLPERAADIILEAL